MTVVRSQSSVVSAACGLWSVVLLCFALCTMLFALYPPASAQQPKKVFRIGYLSNADPATDSTRAGGLRLALRELGYIE